MHATGHARTVPCMIMLHATIQSIHFMRQMIAQILSLNASFMVGFLQTVNGSHILSPGKQQAMLGMASASIWPTMAFSSTVPTKKKPLPEASLTGWIVMVRTPAMSVLWIRMIPLRWPSALILVAVEVVLGLERRLIFTFPIGIPMKVTGLSDESANSMYHFDISNW